VHGAARVHAKELAQVIAIERDEVCDLLSLRLDEAQPLTSFDLEADVSTRRNRDGHPRIQHCARTAHSKKSFPPCIALGEDQARQIADAFGLFGPPETCAERLLQAREEAGAFLMVGLHSASIRAALRHLEQGAARAGRSLSGFPVVFVITLGLGSAEAGTRWVRSWFAPGQPFLAYPSASNLYWLKEAGFELEPTHDPAALGEDQARQIADAFGLFG